MRYSAIIQESLKLYFYEIKIDVGRIVLCVMDRTAAGISGHLIARNSWCDPGSWAELKSIKCLLPIIGGSV